MSENEVSVGKFQSSKDGKKITVEFDTDVRYLDFPMSMLLDFLNLQRHQQNEVRDLIQSYANENSAIESMNDLQKVSSGRHKEINELKTKKDKILALVNNIANPTYLPAADIQEAYQHHTGEEISTSTLQTTLQRLVDDGFIQKQDDSKPFVYRIDPQKSAEAPKILL